MIEKNLRDIVVTGGAGFIGSNFVRWTMEHDDGIRVTVLDALAHAGNIHNLDGLDRERLNFARGDICDGNLVRELLATADACVHFAAQTHNDLSIASPDEFVRTNVTGTFTLLEAVREEGIRFHHVSTDEVFGELPLDSGERFTEESLLPPLEPLQLHKGVGRHARARMGANLRHSGHDLQLHEQLRALSARGEVHPPPDHQHPHGAQAATLRRQAQRSRLDRARCGRSYRRAKSAKPA